MSRWLLSLVHIERVERTHRMQAAVGVQLLLQSLPELQAGHGNLAFCT